jgi:hypothetical protein
MENCCGAKAAFDDATAAAPLVITEATPNGLRFDVNDSRNSGIDAHLERKANASIDFGDVSTRTFEFSTGAARFPN